MSSYMLLKKKKYSEEFLLSRKQRVKSSIHITNIEKSFILSDVLRIFTRFGRIMKSTVLKYGGGSGTGDYYWCVIEYSNPLESNYCFTQGGFELGSNRVKISFVREAVFDGLIFQDVKYPIVCSSCKGSPIRKESECPCSCRKRRTNEMRCLTCSGKRQILCQAYYYICDNCLGKSVEGGDNEDETISTDFDLSKTLVVCSSLNRRYNEDDVYGYSVTSCPSCFSYFELDAPDYRTFLSTHHRIQHTRRFGHSVDQVYLHQGIEKNIIAMSPYTIRVFDVSKSFLKPQVLMKPQKFCKFQWMTNQFSKDRILTVSKNQMEQCCLELYSLRTGKLAIKKNNIFEQSYESGINDPIYPDLYYGIKMLQKSDRFLIFSKIDHDEITDYSEFTTPLIGIKLFDTHTWKCTEEYTYPKDLPYGYVTQEIWEDKNLVLCAVKNQFDLYDLKSKKKITYEMNHGDTSSGYDKYGAIGFLKAEGNTFVYKTHSSISLYDVRTFECYNTWQFNPVMSMIRTVSDHSYLPNQYPEILDLDENGTNKDTKNQFITSHGRVLAVWNTKGEKGASLDLQLVDGKFCGYHSIPCYLGNSKVEESLGKKKLTVEIERASWMISNQMEKSFSVKLKKKRFKKDIEFSKVFLIL